LPAAARVNSAAKLFKERFLFLSGLLYALAGVPYKPPTLGSAGNWLERCQDRCCSSRRAGDAPDHWGRARVASAVEREEKWS